MNMSPLKRTGGKENSATTRNKSDRKNNTQVSPSKINISAASPTKLNLSLSPTKINTNISPHKLNISLEKVLEEAAAPFLDTFKDRQTLNDTTDKPLIKQHKAYLRQNTMELN